MPVASKHEASMYEPPRSRPPTPELPVRADSSPADRTSLRSAATAREPPRFWPRRRARAEQRLRSYKIAKRVGGDVAQLASPGYFVIVLQASRNRKPARQRVRLLRQSTEGKSAGMVPRRGLEPPRIAPLVPETSASTSSATWARWSASREAQECTHWVGACQSGALGPREPEFRHARLPSGVTYERNGANERQKDRRATH